MRKYLVVLLTAALTFIVIGQLNLSSAAATDCIGGGVTPYTVEICP